ncbi:DUF6049 family protein [uncultured Actinomyces sp.]|uniref:DUF6049 family protein n=1 Tax=uncultured Actinomyces sp. TaxID=249061 RepID=UPI0028E23019|nr:DUF6049 family protein [uncultured Actinomyces sp.]
MTRQWSIRRAARFLCGITASLALALAPSVCCAAQPGLPPSQALAAQSAPAAGTAPSQAPLVEGEVTLRVDALAPEVLTKGQDLTVSGTITNGTQETLDRAALSVQVQDHTEIITTDLESWLADERESSLTTSLTQDLHAPVPPGATGTFSVTVPAADLPLSSTREWGPRGVQVSLAQGATTVAKDRSLLIWSSDATPSRATGVTTVIPVTASPSELIALSTVALSPPTSTEFSTQPADSATVLPTQDPAPAPSGVTTTVERLRQRVLGLLALAGDGVVLAVDPALLKALGVPATPPPGSGQATASPTPAETPSAEPSPTTSASTTPSPSSTATSTASPGAKYAFPATDPLTAALTKAVSAGEVIALPWNDADVPALAHLGETDLISSALERSASPQTVAAGAATDTAWVEDLDSQTLSALPASTTTLIAPASAAPVAEDLTYTPSGTTLIDDRVVLLSDPSLSQALASTLSTGSSRSPLCELDSRQLLRGLSAIITRQAPALNRNLVVTLGRGAATNPQALGRRLEALMGNSWSEPRTLSRIVSDTRASQNLVERQDLAQQSVSQTELSTSELEQARDVEHTLGSIVGVLASPTTQLEGVTQVVSTVTSTAWRDDPSGRQRALTADHQVGTRITQSLGAAPSSTINLIAQSADVPVRITSSLNQAATVQVRIFSSSTRLQPLKPVTITVPARGGAVASLPVSAVGSGDVNLTIHILAPDGTVVGTPAILHMRVRANWESRGVRVGASALVILLVVGVVRTIRSGRRQGPRSAAAPHPAT